MTEKVAENVAPMTAPKIQGLAKQKISPHEFGPLESKNSAWAVTLPEGVTVRQAAEDPDLWKTIVSSRAFSHAIRINDSVLVMEKNRSAAGLLRILDFSQRDGISLRAEHVWAIERSRPYLTNEIGRVGPCGHGFAVFSTNDPVNPIGGTIYPVESDAEHALRTLAPRRNVA